MTPQPLLNIGPQPDEQLVAALFTSFEPPDRNLLADRLLPGLLGHAPARLDDTQEFKRARAELCDALARLRGRIVVVSSCRTDKQLPWLSSYVRFYRTFTVQHAKLWMLQWRHASGAERLELIVSSANLTTSGIDSQIQGAWRTSVPLRRASQRNKSSWADLPHFLAYLNESIGPNNSMQQFTELIERAACPAGVRFVATIPNNAGWGTASLKRALHAMSLKPCKLRIVAPFVGAWTCPSTGAWLKACGAGKVTELEIAAVESASTVPEQASWILPKATRDNLWDADPNGQFAVCFGLLSNEVSKTLRGGASTLDDPRWTHAKLYEFSDGDRSALLITSANFTPTAWDTDGNGNFELGVLLNGEVLPFRAPLARCRDQVQARGSPMMDGAGLWASAEWDGQHITVYVTNHPDIQVVFKSKNKQKVSAQGRLRKIVVSHCGTPPAIVTVKQGKHSICVPIVDVRPAPDDLPIGDLPAESWQEWRDQLLLERYGYTPEPGDPPPRQKRGSNHGSEGDYSVSMLNEARRFFNYVDGWQEQFDSGKLRPHVLADGNKLLEVLRRYRTRPHTTPQVLDAVADELALRLQLANIHNGQA